MWKNLIYIVSYGCWSKEYLKTSRLDMLSIPDRFTSCTFCKHFLLWTGVLHTGQLTMTRHLRRPVALTLAQIAECLAVKLTLHVFTMSRLGFEHPTFRLRSEHSNTMHHRRCPHLGTCSRPWRCYLWLDGDRSFIFFI